MAAAAGVVTVSGAAVLVDQLTLAESCPPYHPQRERFNVDTFGGRFAQMLLACDPALLLYTNEQVLQAKALLDRHSRGANDDKAGDDGSDTPTNPELWKARRIVDAAIHPDTGEIIPRPFRMSGYVPYNGPVCVAMIVSTSTWPLLFWSFINQSQNALVNYFNRNASSPTTNQTLTMSYGAAVTSSLTVAFGLATLIQRRFPPAEAQRMLRWVAFPSSVVASTLNCYIMRSPELVTGIPLLDEHGRNVLPGQNSQQAARAGVIATTASRALLPAPVFFVPPLLLGAPLIRQWVAQNPAMRNLPMSTFLLLVSFGLGLPSTVAVFPRLSPIANEAVEAPFQHLQNPATGKPYAVFYYNKGL